MSWGYGSLAAEVYDLDKPIGSSFGDVEYYEQSLRDVGGLILEPAVGTGRMLIPLWEAGLVLEGYDNSPEMLAICRARCSARGIDPVLHEADMTTFMQKERYRAVIVPTGSISLITGRDRLTQALKGFHDCLTTAGQIIIDVPAPDVRGEPAGMRSWTAGEEVLTLQTMHAEYDPAQNQTLQWLRYEKWRNGALVTTELQMFRLQQWSLTEFATIIGECGFSDVVVTGDYAPDSTPGADTGIWTFHANRS